jgi:hypothetical protein
LFLAALFVTASYAGVVVDRVAVAVGKHAIKTSDIDLDIRITEFLNREPLKLDSARKHQSAERLIDQEIIRQQIVSGGFRRPSAEEAAKLEAQLLRDRFGGSNARLRAALAPYGITEEELCAQLLWQLTVLGFIDQRFRATAVVSDDDVRAYYNQHWTEPQRQRPAGESFESVEQQIRKTIEGEQVDKNFNEWLERARKEYRIEYRQEAFE